MLPPLIRIRQRLNPTCLTNPKNSTKRKLKILGLENLIRKGEKVGIAVGSRGIAALPQVLEALVEVLVELGTKPVFVPAMGSHGGAKPKDQKRLVAEIIGPKLACLPILASMEVKKLGLTTSGLPVYFSAEALAVDKLVLVNRIKPHTDFRGKIGSGLLKMLSIGLGKHKGAQVYHYHARELGLERVIREVAKVILARAPVALGIGLVENAFGQLAEIKAMEPKEFILADEIMLKKAIRLMPKLPFDEMNVLIVDEIGKDISGNGLDTNIVGRYPSLHLNHPKIDVLFVRALSEKSRGNAIGIGLADATTKKLVEQIDLEATRVNCLTSQSIQLGRIPLVFENDRHALEALVRLLGLKLAELKILWIRNTMQLSECFASVAYRTEIAAREDLELVEENLSFSFDGQGNLLPPRRCEARDLA
ncbi:MAG: DUF2088 domain-containing protein [Deltaproteobacteria bacterium]|nr:DUF2088 domain-containing protein [Deltaproteobacteria bacterium]